MSGIAHGGRLDAAIRQHGGRPEQWLDLSTGINPVPYPVPPLAVDVWHRLPDEAMLADCIAAARDYYGAAGDAAVCAAPGSQALIQKLPLLFDGGNAWQMAPTYGEYALQGKVTETDAWPPDFSRIPNAVVCRPNNPDGRILDRETLEAMLASAAEAGGVVVVDEAFCDVTPDVSLAGLAGHPALVIFRSFGKFFGLAGLRLGFAIGPADRINALEQAFGPWAVSGPALQIGIRAMRDRQWIASTRERLSADAARLGAMLAAHGFEIEGGTDLFVLARHGAASDIAQRLGGRHILVRSFDALPGRLRFGLPGTDDAFERLDRALADATSNLRD